MIYLTQQDLEQRITAGVLMQITNGDTAITDNAEEQAIGIVKDFLSGLYDIDAELQKTGNERHTVLKMWLVSLACYFLYAHIPDNELPERVFKDYDDTFSALSKIASGKQPTTLTQLINEETGTTKRVVRFGFNEKRDHQIL